MRGFKTNIGSAFKMGLGETSCVACGQCIAVCPTGALREKSCIAEVFEEIADPTKVVLVQTAPAVRAALGESFGNPIGTDVQGKLAAALRRLGFDKVFDTNFGADLTIMEESCEFIERLKKGRNLPLITSCSPGWVKYCEHYYPEMTDNLSSCKMCIRDRPRAVVAGRSTWGSIRRTQDSRNSVFSVLPAAWWAKGVWWWGKKGPIPTMWGSSACKNRRSSARVSVVCPGEPTINPAPVSYTHLCL